MLFDLQGSQWAYSQTIAASQAFTDLSSPVLTDGFGGAIAFDGSSILVGARYAKRRPASMASGQAYLFQRNWLGTWEETRVFQEVGAAQIGGWFGFSVSIERGFAVVGDFTGMDTSGVLSGTALIYELDHGLQICDGVVNSTGEAAHLRVNGSTTAGDGLVTCRIEDAVPGQAGLLVASQAPGFVAHPGGSMGNLCLSGALARVGVALADGEGRMLFNLDTSAMPLNPAVAIGAGDTWCFQLYYRDHLAGTTSNFSNAVEVLFD
ncbi:MAG: hypothetical protein R3E96_16025 [Planctomycetota bacterium]